MNPTDLILNSSLIWLMGSGLLLGGLHALEPGHAKTLIASFVVATRGSVPQAVVLGLSAAVSHSVLIWVLAGAALYFGNQFIGDEIEPWLQLATGVAIVGIGLSMIWRLTRRGSAVPHEGIGPRGGQIVDTGGGLVEVTVFEDGVPPEFRIFFYDPKLRPAAAPLATMVAVRTIRGDGSAQSFAFSSGEDCLVSTTIIPEPHEFVATLSLAHDGHAHDYVLAFSEPPGHAHPPSSHSHDHDHDHDHDHAHTHDHHHDHGHHHLDAHARAHARQIEGRFDGRSVNMSQVAWFGLSSGLMPCPAALTMLLLCLRLKRVVLGIGLVTAFSLGLAVTLVTLGVIASLGVKHASNLLPGLDRWTGVLPYVSGVLVIGVGVFMGVSGFSNLG